MTDTELQWRFLRAKLISHGMYLSEKLQEAILTQELIDSRKLANSLRFKVNMEESQASGKLVIEFKIYGRFQEISNSHSYKKEIVVTHWHALAWLVNIFPVFTSVATVAVPSFQ